MLLFPQAGDLITFARPGLQSALSPPPRFHAPNPPRSSVKKLANPPFQPHAVPMHLAHLRLRDFRNYPRLDIDFAPGFHVLLGDNAQGKTNILESIYLMATLRSFRGVGGAQMIRHGQKGYFVGGKVVGRGTHEIKMYWSVSERQ